MMISSNMMEYVSCFYHKFRHHICTYTQNQVRHRATLLVFISRRDVGISHVSFNVGISIIQCFRLVNLWTTEEDVLI